MANRLVLGKGRSTTGSDYGLWVSKPGKDVLTCDPEDLMFDSLDRKYGEVLAAGSFTGSASIQVQMPNNKPPFVYTQRFNSIGGFSLGEAGVGVSYSFSGTVCTVDMTATISSSTIYYIIVSLET